MGSYALYVVLRAVSLFVCALPAAVALWLGRRVGDLGFILLSKRRRIAFRNLRFAFGDEKTPREGMRIVRGVFQNTAQTAVELMRFPLFDRDSIGNVYRLEGEEHMQAAIRRGKGTIYLTAHFGNWELSSFGSGWLGYQLIVLAREQKHSLLNDYVNRMRCLAGADVATKGFDIRRVLSHLAQNGLCGILSDQDSGAKGVWVKFFGRLTSSPSGAFEIAQRTGCALLPTFVVRERGGRHVSYIMPDLARTVLDTPGDKDQKIRALAQAFANELERFIRRYPDQWLWVHKRWKSTPQDRVWILSDGKAGHLNQSLAVADGVRKAALRKARGRVKALDEIYTSVMGPGQPHGVSEVTYRSRWAGLKLALLARLARPSPERAWRWLQDALTPASFDSLRGAHADFFISCGASVAPVNRVLGDMTSARTICVMKPVFPSPTRFDLIIAPRHDRMDRTRPGVVVTDTAPHRMSPADLEGVRVEARRSFPRIRREHHVGLCVGGETNGYHHKLEDTARLIDTLTGFCERHGWGLLATTTRRTDQKIETLISKRLEEFDPCELLVIANRENPPGAMQATLALSDIVVVSEDSFSMVSEALGSGRPVVVYRVGRKGSPKQSVSLDRLAGSGRLVAASVEELDRTLDAIVTGRAGPAAPDSDRQLIEEAVEKIL